MLRASLLLSGAFFAAAVLTGCGAGTVTTTNSGTLALSGHLQGGQQAVSGSTIQIYVAGTSGNGSAASPLIPTGSYAPGGVGGCVASGSQVCYPTVQTDASGNFNITGDFTCPSSTAQVYVAATGGNPGLASGTNNAALSMVAALGPCSNLTTTPFIFIDEVTTVAAAWALAPFMTDTTHLGASSTNAAGLTNAFLDANLLANTTNGNAATNASNLTVETGKLYALADAIAGCVNSDGTSGCTPLFTAATPAGGTAPTDTLKAALQIVKNPGQNVAAVFRSFSGISAPYATTLTQAPNDWTMSLTITGGGLFMPTALGIDSASNVWVTGQIGPLSEFGPQGTPISTYGAGTSEIEQAYGLAIDSVGSIWVINYNSPYNSHGSVTKFLGSNTGTPGAVVTGTGGNPTFYDSSIQFPDAISANANGQIFMANNGYSSATVYDSNGNLVAGDLGANLGLQAYPQGIAADNSGGFWLADDDNTIAHISSSGALLSHPNCCYSSYQLATDATGNVWVSNYLNSTFSEVAANGTVVINQSGVGGVATPGAVAVDAGGNVWFANYQGASIAEIAGNQSTVLAGTTKVLAAGTAISPTVGTYANGSTGENAGGYGLDASVNEPFSIVPDQSGNVWISNQGNTDLVMFFGLATPTRTPTMPVPVAP